MILFLILSVIGLIGWIIIFKKKERMIHLNQINYLKGLLYSMKEGVLITDTKGDIDEMNLVFASIFNLDPHTNYHQKPVGLVLQIPEIQKIVDDILSGQYSSIEKELRLLDKKYIHVTASPFITYENQMIGVLLVINDISRLKELEGMRRTFAANVSHELRTPLTSIQGYVETLLDGKVNDVHTQRNFLDVVFKHTVRLRGIIEDLLALSKIESIDDSGELEMICSDITMTIKAAVLQCEEKARMRNINIHCTNTNTLMIKHNSRLMEQAIYNLIDNAIKFSPEQSQVEVVLSSSEKEIEISVSDQGKGIQKKHQQRIFERFYMVDKARSRELGGSGLGLSIVKHIALIHGGRVDVKSELDQGACFYIYLPLTLSA